MSSDRPELACVILGAGEGRRLRPFTTALPKPMLTILDRPIIDHLLERVAALGDVPIHVNLHHAADVLDRHLRALDRPSLHWQREAELTGPAGALRLFVEELSRYPTILVLSGDVIFADSLHGLVSTHRDSGAELTFAATEVTDAHRYGVLTLGAGDRVLQTREKPDVPPHERHWISGGVYCLESKLLAEIPADQVFDFAADLAPALLAAGRRVHAHRLRGYWNDLGRPSALRRANLDAVTGLVGHLSPATVSLDASVCVEGSVHIGEGVRLGRGAVVIGPAVLGRGSVIGADSWIQNSVLLPGSAISPATVLVDSITGPLQQWAAVGVSQKGL